jgi:4-amino-4-deoxy-L-arabinose transferase-like glycosyltransferase
MWKKPGPLEETEPVLFPDYFFLGFILLWGLAWLLPGLSHPSIHNWDESMHMAVARGTAENFPTPTMYIDPFFQVRLSDWWNGQYWMHKPPGVFWWAAAMLNTFGTSTLALRSASLLGQLGMALLMYLMGRQLAGKWLAFLCSLTFLVLPWGWLMTHGHMIGDVLDISVSAFVTLSMAWMWFAVEKDSWRWALACGAAIGVGYLTKSFLAVTPLAVVGLWWFLGLVRFCRGPSFTQLLAVYLGFAVVALPWQFYAYHHFHDTYWTALTHTLSFLSKEKGQAELGHANVMPFDAVINDINKVTNFPFPYPFTLLCAIWMAVKAVRDRDGRLIALTLWLWVTWLVHSVSYVKGPTHLWNAVPATFVAYMVTLRDAYRHRALGAAVIASFLVWEYRPVYAPLVELRKHLPAFLVQTRSWQFSNLVEQFVLVLPTAAAAWGLGVLVEARKKLLQRITVALAVLACLGTAAYGFPMNFREHRAQFERMDRDRQYSATQDVGLALEHVLDKKSVFYMDTQYDYGVSFEYLNLLFWSGRMTFRLPPNLAQAQEKGYHPYLVSPTAEPFAVMEQVPNYSGLRAYDLLKPAPWAPLPSGLKPVEGQLATLKPLGWAARRIDGRWSRYAFYFQPLSGPSDLRAIFHLENGTTVEYPLHWRSTLQLPQRLASVQWFLMSNIGPPHEQVVRVELK